ncbi:hypothetical protein [Streptomyces sp. ISID311]|uniref:hypothetical protein n=1 Tax=Streptomyces sp. ISID311 TaxID=2601673 RepID=UPI0011BD31B1|nr:hypothetical protein [Streptomyces sp. ISID311]TXC98819.1 hypothetical protein FS847_05325 [Streptomyces sp. ISID311]
MPYHQSRRLFDKPAAAHKDARFFSFPHTGHGTFLEMLSDVDTQRGASQETTRNGHTTRPTPAHPSWQTVVSFLKSELHIAGRQATRVARSRSSESSLSCGNVPTASAVVGGVRLRPAHGRREAAR